MDVPWPQQGTRIARILFLPGKNFELETVVQVLVSIHQPGSLFFATSRSLSGHPETHELQHYNYNCHSVE